MAEVCDIILPGGPKQQHER